MSGSFLECQPSSVAPLAFTHFDCHPEVGHPYRAVSLLAAIAIILKETATETGLDRYRWLLDGGNEVVAFRELAERLVHHGYAVYDGDAVFEVYNPYQLKNMGDGQPCRA